MTPLITLKNRPLIYAIRNMINGKLYIGKTRCIYRRCHQYLRAVKTGNTDQMNEYLMKSILKNGISNFEMFPVEFTTMANSASRELWWMDHFGTLDRSKGYNLRYDSSTGMLVSESTRNKISVRLKQEWASGARDHHSKKMKDCWSNDLDRKERQSVLLSKTKTKYQYVVTDPIGVTFDCDYRGLVTLGLKNVFANFHRSGGSSVTIKGYIVQRFSKGKRDEN